VPSSAEGAEVLVVSEPFPHPRLNLSGITTDEFKPQSLRNG
jgi:hypothetical protein